MMTIRSGPFGIGQPIRIPPGGARLEAVPDA
jgi:hypothetical protein